MSESNVTPDGAMPQETLVSRPSARSSSTAPAAEVRQEHPQIWAGEKRHHHPMTHAAVHAMRGWHKGYVVVSEAEYDAALEAFAAEENR